jgi:hypothetical protein
MSLFEKAGREQAARLLTGAAHLGRPMIMRGLHRKLLRFGLLVAPLAAFAVAGGGCLINSASEEVIEPDAPRTSVQFESEKGMGAFQKEAENRYRSGGGERGSGAFAIPFVIAVSEKRVLSENAFYNTQVRKADVNGDGAISDAEARVYAGS